MKFNKFLLLLVTIIILSVSTTYVLYKIWYKEVKINEFGMDITITAGGFVGINVDKDAIHFGIIPIGSNAKRYINLTNTQSYNVFVYATKDNSKLSKIVTISPNYFTLKANENKQINVSVYVPEGFEPGNYSGKITFIQRVPFYRTTYWR